MILPTMNDKEKCTELGMATGFLCDAIDKYFPHALEKFMKGTRFPYFQRFHLKDDKMNNWTLMFFVTSKEQKKKGNYQSFAYVTYDIPRKRIKEDVNAGRGLMFFNPYRTYRWLYMKDREKHPFPFMFDFTPHAINRYTTRYLEPHGMVGIEFKKKVESIMLNKKHFDICADLEGDISAAKHKGNICPYDLIMKNGIFRGVVANNMLVRLNTYISDEMLFENQKNRHEEMIKENLDWKRRGIIK